MQDVRFAGTPGLVHVARRGEFISPTQRCEIVFWPKLPELCFESQIQFFDGIWSGNHDCRLTAPCGQIGGHSFLQGSLFRWQGCKWKRGGPAECRPSYK